MPRHLMSAFSRKLLAIVLHAVLATTLVAPAPAAAADKKDAKPASTAAAKKKSTAPKAKPKADAKAAAKAKPKAKPKATAKAGKAAKLAKDGDAKAAGKTAAARPAAPKHGPLADFGKVKAPAEVVHTANWASYIRDNGGKPFVVIDKKNAQLYVFDGRAKLKNRTPVLLGKAVGDTVAPGVGSLPLSQIKDEHKTTPAGRYRAFHGRNTHGEDIIWIDYDAAVSMHRVRNVKDERRPQRLATADIGDNRISNGCVNVPPGFYNKVLRPSVSKSHGAMVYVLPETRTPQQLFGSFDVPQAGGKAVQLATAEAGKGKS